MESMPARTRSAPANHPWLRPLLLPAILLAMLPPMLVQLGASDVAFVMERITLVSSWETKAAIERGGEREAWWVPRIDGGRRLEKPPMAVWLHLAAWADLPVLARPDTFAWRARLLSVAMAGLAVIGAWWAGWSLGRWRVAAGAAVTLAGTFFFIRQARYATYDTHLMAWATLSVAAGLWAVRPIATRARRRAGLRWWLGWGLAGVFLAAGVLTKGPIALVFTALPLAAAAAVIGGGWRRHAAGVGLMLLVAVPLAGWWYAYVHLHLPDEARHIAAELAARSGREFGHAPKPLWHYVILLGMVAPFTGWFIAGLLYPLTREHGRRRRRLLAALLWVVVPLVVMSLHPSKKPRYIVPLLPPAAIVTAAVAAYHHRLARCGGRDAGWRWLWALHWAGMAAATLGVVAVFAAPRQLVMHLTSRGYTTAAAAIRDAVMAGPDPRLRPFIGLGGGVLLGGLVVVGALMHRRKESMGAVVATAAWTLVVATLGFAAYAGSAADTNEDRRPGELVRRITGGPPRVLVLDTGRDAKLVSSSERFYAQTVYQRVSPEQLAAQRDRPDATWVVAHRDDTPALRSARYRVVTTYDRGGVPVVIARHDPR